MPAPLEIVVTNAGRAAIVNAQNNGTAPVTITQIGVSATAVTALPTAVALAGEIKRIAAIAGEVVADDTIHVTLTDESADAYTLRSLGLYLADGTLFAIYGQAGPVLEKTAQSIAALSIDVIFADIAAAALTFGNANFTNPPATTERQGVVELTTVAEAQAGIDALRALTPAAAKAAILGWLLAQDGSGSGLDADLLDGQDGSYYSDIPARLTYTPVQQGTGIGQQANPIKIGWSGTRVKVTVNTTDQGGIVTDNWLASATLPIVGLSVARGGYALWGPDNDGAGSGLDADLLDGQNGSYYSNVTGLLGYTPVQMGTGIGQSPNVVKIGWSGIGRLKATVDNVDQGSFVFDANIADVWRASNDGSGSGLDADLLDGQEGSYYSNVTGLLGYTPVQMATGIGQSPNVVKIGWSGIGRLKATVDNVDQGSFVFDANIADVWRASNDGSGSGLDADLLDGQQGSFYSDIAGRLGFTPVQQGTGVGQLANPVKIGWSGSRVKATVNTTDIGNIVFDANISDVWRASNDGSGSGLDADLLDGLQASDFLRDLAHSFLDSGYLRLSNGLILQWGSVAGTWSANVDISVSYPIAFPTALLGIVGSNSDVAAQKDAVLGINYTPAPTASSFKFRTNVGGQNRLNWIAIGI